VARPVLSLRLKADASPANDPQWADPQAILSSAIARSHCVRGRYNSGEVVLQPCLLYREHDALFLLAVTALRDGKPPREAKLSTFRVSGLTDLRAIHDSFVPGELHRGWFAKPTWDMITGL